MYSPVEGGGLQKTDLHCHECSKTFVAELDYDITGNHVVECPHCGHEHCRVIQNGKITSERWDSRPSMHSVRVSPKSVWKSNVIQCTTSTVAQFLRDKWLNHYDIVDLD